MVPTSIFYIPVSLPPSAAPAAPAGCRQSVSGSAGVDVTCEAGFDGGLNVTFILEVWSNNDSNTLLGNLASDFSLTEDANYTTSFSKVSAPPGGVSGGREGSRKPLLRGLGAPANFTSKVRKAVTYSYKKTQIIIMKLIYMFMGHFNTKQ